MALSDKQREKDKKRKARPINAVTNLRWSDQQKVDAAKSWLVLGNLAMVSRLHGIPRDTLTNWQETEWWHDLINDLRMQEKIELSAKMKSLVSAAHSVVANRLEAGDAVLNQKTGQIVYKPVSMKDAHRVAVDMLNQKQTLDKATLGPEIKETDGNKLEQLAETFAMFAARSIQKQIDKTRTIDALVEDISFRTEENEVAQTVPLSAELLPSDGDGAIQEVGEEEQTGSRNHS